MFLYVVHLSLSYLWKNSREIAAKEPLRNACERILRKNLWKTLKKELFKNEISCKPNFTFLRYTTETWFQSPENPKKRAHKNKTAKP